MGRPGRSTMGKFFNAAKRDAAGILKLYIHLFFRGGVGKAHGGTMGERAMTTLAIWGIGLMAPFFLGTAVLATMRQNPMAGVLEAAVLLGGIWALYRLYRIVKPASQAGTSDHVRGAEIDDQSGEQ